MSDGRVGIPVGLGGGGISCQTEERSMREVPRLDRRVDEKVKSAMKRRETRRSSRWVGACIAQGGRINDGT